MIWYVRSDSMHELDGIPKTDNRGLTIRLNRMLEQEKAFTTDGYEETLSPATLASFRKLLETGKFIKVTVG